MLLFSESKYIDLIVYPTFDFNITDRYFSLKMLVLITLRSLKRNMGLGFPVPKGSIFFISE